MLTQENKINVELIKKIMNEKKTTLRSLRNQEWKNGKVENENVNKLLTNIQTGNITERNEPISAVAKLNSYKIVVNLRNANRNTKPGKSD